MRKYALRYFPVSILLFLSCDLFSEELNSLSEDSLSRMNKRIEWEYLFFKTDNKEEKIKYKIEIAKSLRGDNRVAEALSELDSAIAYASGSELSFKPLMYEAYYQRAFCLFMTDSFSLADSALKKITSAYADSIYSKRVALLSALTLNHLERFDDSKRLFTGSLLYHHIDTTGINNAYAKAETATYRSVRKTIRLARFLPGAGFFYVHKPSEGFVSVALQIGFLGYTAYSIYSGYYITAALTGLRNVLRFHGGGVRASAQYARKYNQKEKEKVLFVIDDYCINALK